MKAAYFRIGQFSLINDSLLQALRSQMSNVEWREIDVEVDIVNSSPQLRLRATIEALVRYGSRVLAERRPPRDFFPRLPSVLSAVKAMSSARMRDCRFTFQTQSLFDASIGGVPHFLYTDHTYLANRRYAQPKALLPVASRWRSMERDLYETAACCFVSSEFARNSLLQDYGIEPERAFNVGSGCNLSLPDRRDSSRRRGCVILFVGVDWDRKGGPELLAAFRQIRKRWSEAELWVVGCQPKLECDGVQVFGRLDATAVADVYSAADIFCLPSRMDPSASVLAEAAGFWLPVVATRVGGNLERVRHEVSGFLVESEDELVARLDQLLADSDLRLRMGEAGRSLVEENFTWRAVAAKIAGTIEACLESAVLKGGSGR